MDGRRGGGGGRGRGQQPRGGGFTQRHSGSNHQRGRAIRGRGSFPSNRFINWRGRTNRGGQNNNSPPPPQQPSSNQQVQINNPLLNQHPNYNNYFKSPPSIKNLSSKLEAATNYINTKFTTKSELDKIEISEFYDLDYDELASNQELTKTWPSLSEDLDQHPSDIIRLLALAMDTLITATTTTNEKEQQPPLFITPRLMRSHPLTQISSIKSSLLGRLITVRGSVIRSGQERPHILAMGFECGECSTVFKHDLQDGKFSYPRRCPTHDCNGANFSPVTTSSPSTTSLVDSRRIRLQESASLVPGFIPRTVDCLLFGSLVSLANAGDSITICGLVKLGNNPGSESLHNLYIQVVSLKNDKDTENKTGVTFTDLDYFAVREIHDMDNLFRLLVASLCPSIYGKCLLKAGLLLALFGGTQDENGIVTRRSDVNVLMVGDPGLGKSQLLVVLSEVSPRGVYVCGTGATTAGLTVTLVRDGDEYSLEAGALVLADRGLCCIDEFDKMAGQHSALLEAMEQQSISIAKSGVFRTLPARTSVIAAANPAGGHYDKLKTVGENIKISPALLSRFDLTFVMLDEADEETDRNIVRHVMGIKMGGASSQSSTQIGAASQNESLRSHLHIPADEEVDLIPHHLIRKYVAYARQYVKPVLSKEAAAVVKEYYLNLRLKQRGLNSTPVTTRQLESLVRLVQARAKLDLREVATALDARQVLEIYEYGMEGVFDSEIVTGLTQLVGLDSFNTSTASGSSTGRSQTKKQSKKLISTLQLYATEQKRQILSSEEIKQIARALGLSSSIDNLISSLNNEGYLLSKGGGKYKLQSVDF